MKSLVVILLLLAQPTYAACRSGANVAGCVGPNGNAATYNKNTGEVHTGSTSSSTVAPGAHVQGVYGNSATKAVQPGCAWVNGQRVCN
jgi:hypothetical protein